MADRESLDLCDAQSEATGKRRWTLSLAKAPQDIQMDQTMRHLMGDFAREVAIEFDECREPAGGCSSRELRGCADGAGHVCREETL